MTTVLHCIVQALLESIQFLYKCCHLDNKAALLKRAGFILILALLNGEYTLAGEQWTKKRVTNLSWQLHAKEEKMHYDSVVCSAPSQGHFQTKMAFCAQNWKLFPDFAHVSSNPITHPVRPYAMALLLGQRWEKSLPPSHSLPSPPVLTHHPCYLETPMLFLCLRHTQPGHCIVRGGGEYLPFFWFTLLSSQWNLTSELLRLPEV